MNMHVRGFIEKLIPFSILRTKLNLSICYPMRLTVTKLYLCQKLWYDIVYNTTVTMFRHPRVENNHLPRRGEEPEQCPAQL